jgi:hypothetical protein
MTKINFKCATKLEKTSFGETSSEGKPLVEESLSTNDLNIEIFVKESEIIHLVKNTGLKTLKFCQILFFGFYLN